MKRARRLFDDARRFPSNERQGPGFRDIQTEKRANLAFLPPRKLAAGYNGAIPGIPQTVRVQAAAIKKKLP
jgi:hypothetical protein